MVMAIPPTKMRVMLVSEWEINQVMRHHVLKMIGTSNDLRNCTDQATTNGNMAVKFDGRS